MKAVAYSHILPTSEDFLQDITLEMPAAPEGHDLLVKIEAVSVNPVDTKVRKRVDPEGLPKVLGYDAAGVVERVGAGVTLFQPGDKVFYAGSIDRPGTNAEYHLVDERIVGAMPESLDFSQAAALPLTAITAWEALFDRLGITAGEEGGAVLILGGAGGVGSIATQLARQLTGLTVIATASRPESQAWCQKMGAHHVLNHAGDMVAQAANLGVPIKYVFSTNATEQHWDAIGSMIAPQGKICLIDDPEEALDIRPLKRKAVSVSWEFMFTRALFGTDDMVEQHNLLNAVSAMIDKGALITTTGEVLGSINAENLRAAHLAIESGKTMGKIVLASFD